MSPVVGSQRRMSTQLMPVMTCCRMTLDTSLMKGNACFSDTSRFMVCECDMDVPSF